VILSTPDAGGKPHGATRSRLFLSFWLVLAAAAPGSHASAPRIKVLADQDSAGPHGTNFLSLLMLLSAPEFDLLGITTVSGDQWVDQETLFALHALELTGRTEVPVVKGAVMPLLNTAKEQEAREALYGSHAIWHGAFNPDAPPPARTWAPPGGHPKIGPRPGHAVNFIVETIRANPGEVVLYAAGPLTNIALAVRLAPDIVELTRALYLMGGSSQGGWELNWWFDPEAAAIVMREPWREIVVTTAEAGAMVWSNEAMMRRIAESGGRLSEHVRALYLDYQSPEGHSVWSLMWDELSVALMLDPELATRWDTLYLDVVIEHGPKYGHTLVWREPEGTPRFFLPHSGPDPLDPAPWQGHLSPPLNRRPSRVPVEVDVQRFESLVVKLLSR
jgi:inosine-uridine nucleoside N-ribohydrolase